MRTDDLIAALAADNRQREAPIERTLLIAFGFGSILVLAGFLAALGPREDIAAAFETWRFDLKLALVALAVLCAALDVNRLARPLPRKRRSALLFVPPLLVAAVVAELLMLPSSEWRTRLVGTNALECLTIIPALAVAPLFVLLYGMRRGAPSSPTTAGAAAGALAAAIAAGFYALNCFDDSPLFVATWYGLAALLVISTGALLGRHLLRW